MQNKYNYKSLTGVVLLLVTFMLGLPSVGHAGHNIKLKLAVIAPKRTIWGRKLRALAKDIKTKTNGRVKFKIYYGGVQGDELNVVRKMRIGQLHGAGFMARGITRICPDSLVFSIPLIFHSDAEAIWVQKKMQDYLQKQAHQRGYEIIGWTRQGFTYCFSKDRVKDIATLRQAKPWMLESDAFCKSFFKCSRIAAIPAQVGDVMVALQSGLIHTVFAPPIGMLIMQWQSRVKYQLKLGLFYSFGAVVINAKQWNKIAKHDQQIIRKSFNKFNDEINKAIAKQNADALQVLQRKLTVVTPSPAAVKEFHAITEKVEKDMTGKAFSREAMQLMKSYLKAYRQKNGVK